MMENYISTKKSKKNPQHEITFLCCLLHDLMLTPRSLFFMELVIFYLFALA